jgi:predicted DNA-binding transcriptional regulator
MSEILFGILGGIIGFLFGTAWVIVSLIPSYASLEKIKKEVGKTIEECEKNLPRNQHCKITAIPEKVE